MTKNSRYNKIIFLLKSKISKLDVGEKLPPIRQLMEEFDVSQSPLDNALRILEKDGIVRKVRGSGIYVAPHEGKSVTGMIGLVAGERSDNFSPYVVKAFEEKISQAGYQLLYCNSHTELAKEIATLTSLNGKIDGMVLFPYSLNAYNPEYLKYFSMFSKKFPVPIFTLNMPLRGVQSTLVDFDNFGCFHDIIDRINWGEDKVNVVFGGNMSSAANLQRLVGLKAKLQQLEKNIRLICFNTDPAHSNVLSNLESSCKKSYSGKWIFFIANPPALPSFINFIYKRNIRVPEDALIISVMEEDDPEPADISVVSVIKSNRTMGHKAAVLLVESIASNNRNIPDCLIPFELSLPDDILRSKWITH